MRPNKGLLLTVRRASQARHGAPQQKPRSFGGLRLAGGIRRGFDDRFLRSMAGRSLVGALEGLDNARQS
jgi:hypothetical protein